MPHRFRRKFRRGKRRTFRKKLTLQRAIPSGFPAVYKSRLVYSDVFTLTGTTGAQNTHKLNFNGLFNPDLDATGHQPLYFDQLMALYDHYKVLSCRVMAEVVPNAASEESFIIGLVKDDNNSPTTDVLANMEYGTTRLVADSATTPIKLRLNWNLSKTFGKAQVGADKFSGTVGTNPAELTQFYFFVRATDSGSSVTAAIRIKIEYTAIFYERKYIGTS